MTPRRPRARAARRGFATVEVLVAFLVLTIGVLGLAAGATSVTRLAEGGETQTVAAAVAQSHIERLRSQSCAAVTSGQDTVRGVITTWTAQPVARGVDLNLTVQFTMVHGRSTRSFRSILPC